jgi:hypothetical protein
MLKPERQSPILSAAIWRADQSAGAGSGDSSPDKHQGAWEMTGETVSWIMAVRKYGIVTADEMFPDDDEPRPRRPARKLARRVPVSYAKVRVMPRTCRG